MRLVGFFRRRRFCDVSGMRICDVIPAAGRGVRLGADIPKILLPISSCDTIWSILHAKLSPLVDHIHLILSPEGAAAFPPLPAKASTSIQPAPLALVRQLIRQGVEVAELPVLYRTFSGFTDPKWRMRRGWRNLAALL